MIILIIAGGIGSRFWPASSPCRPKQFLTLFGDKSMIRHTFQRSNAIVNSDNIYVVTTKKHTKLVREHLPELSIDNIIIEPFGMNTAACICMSVVYLMQIYDKNTPILIIPADHYLPDNVAFTKSINEVLKVATEKCITIFGVTPTYPATGYGYIEVGEKCEKTLHHVKSFTEKPNHNNAAKMLKKGNYLWNSGMFFSRLRVIAEAFKRHNPQILKLSDDYVSQTSEQSKKETYKQMPSLPFDIAIIEKADNVLVMPISYEWSDVGSWNAVTELMPKDEKGNYFQGKGQAYMAENIGVFSNKPVAVIGVSDIVLVETARGILVVKKDLAEKVKDIQW